MDERLVLWKVQKKSRREKETFEGYSEPKSDPNNLITEISFHS